MVWKLNTSKTLFNLNGNNTMNIELFREACIKLPATEECFPFDDTTLVFKVKGKMYALASLDGEPTVNLKADPDEVIDRIERYPSVIPGYHMNKKHWITVLLDESVPSDLIIEWIYVSYQLVVNSLPKKLQNELLHG